MNTARARDPSASELLTGPPRFCDNHLMNTSAAFLPLAALLFASSSPARSEAPDAGRAAFREQVRPLLTTKCLACHGGDKTRGGLDLRRRTGALAGGDSGPALKPGKAADSLLYRKLAGREMPPQNPLSPEQVAAFKKWIDAGA